MPKIAGLRARTGIPDFGYALGAVFTSFLFLPCGFLPL